MGELMEINLVMQNDTPVVSSIQISESFNKQHGHVLRDIDNLKKDVSNFGEIFFETTIKDTYNRDQRAYLMNRDGFSLLAMGFSGKTALEWKVKYISAFNAMEKAWNSPEMVMARGLQMANKQIDGFKEKVTYLETENKLLAGETLQWADRKILEAIVKKYGGRIGYAEAWREFKKELLYKHGINLNSRITNYMNASGKKTAPKTLSMIHDDELPDCISTAVALCNRNNINISAIINKTA